MGFGVCCCRVWGVGPGAGSRKFVDGAVHTMPCKAEKQPFSLSPPSGHRGSTRFAVNSLSRMFLCRCVAESRDGTRGQLTLGLARAIRAPPGACFLASARNLSSSSNLLPTVLPARRLSPRYHVDPAQLRPPRRPDLPDFRLIRKNAPHRHPPICRRRGAHRPPPHPCGRRQESRYRPGPAGRLLRSQDGRLATGTLLRLGWRSRQGGGLRAHQGAVVWVRQGTFGRGRCGVVGDRLGVGWCFSSHGSRVTARPLCCLSRPARYFSLCERVGGS